jgi:hypothetical protein
VTDGFPTSASQPVRVLAFPNEEIRARNRLNAVYQALFEAAPDIRLACDRCPAPLGNLIRDYPAIVLEPGLVRLPDDASGLPRYGPRNRSRGTRGKARPPVRHGVQRTASRVLSPGSPIIDTWTRATVYCPNCGRRNLVAFAPAL